MKIVYSKKIICVKSRLTFCLIYAIFCCCKYIDMEDRKMTGNNELRIRMLSMIQGVQQPCRGEMQELINNNSGTFEEAIMMEGEGFILYYRLNGQEYFCRLYRHSREGICYEIRSNNWATSLRRCLSCNGQVEVFFEEQYMRLLEKATAV